MNSRRLPAVDSPTNNRSNTFRFDVFSYTSKDKGFILKQKPNRQKSQFILKKNDQIQSAQRIKSINKSMNQECENNYESKYQVQFRDQELKYEILTKENQEQKQEIEQLQKQIRNLQFLMAERTRTQPSQDITILQQQNKQITQEFNIYRRKMEEQLKNAMDQNYIQMDQLRTYKNKVQTLQTSMLRLHQQLLCKYCNKELKEAITLIPCAHTFCKSCTKGYQKMCYICGQDNPSEAKYYNEFIEQMVEMYGTFQQVLKLLNQ